MNSAEANEFQKAHICFAQCAHLWVYDPVRMNKVWVMGSDSKFFSNECRH